MAVFQNSNLETRDLMRSNLDMGFMPLVMILLLALIASLGEGNGNIQTNPCDSDTGNK